MTLLPGYDDRGPDESDGPGLAVDGSALLDLPGFWAAHLDLVGLDLDEELAELFGDRLADIRATYDRLTDLRTWPVFPVDLGDRGRLAVVYRNFDGDLGVDYLSSPGAGRDYQVIASSDGGGSLSWAEIVAAADHQPDPLSRARALLLLTPMLYDTPPDPAAAIDRLADALRTAGVAGDVTAIAGRIVHRDDEGGQQPAGSAGVDR
ncbi:hypothetical protein [Actinoplanes teichomyceticus]|uniref:hypothetical protein n=1 Tax=Actinoplanes teichomyceticus TaxID=1867 RepID=UPI000F0A3952|nr:hypothetical protein [Actinoplanes teichomyceticus]GIF16644.1 hypothetical protein Ate01nite_66760 [Actinoplanes teichomyceticus]